MEQTYPTASRRPWLGTLGAVLGSLTPIVLATGLVATVASRWSVEVPLLGFVVVLVVLRSVTGFVLSVILHRWASHRSLELVPWVRDLFRTWAWFWTGLGSWTWASVHRRHHADPDGPEALFTPAGPRGLLGIGPMTLWAHWDAIRNPEPFERLVRDLPDDRLERFFRAEERRLFGGIGVRVPLLFAAHVLPWLWWVPLEQAVVLAACTLPGSVGAITSSAVWVVNGLGHHSGERAHATPDRSTNLVRVDIWLMGEGLHNNHHARPADPNFAHRPGELDPSYQILRLMAVLGLVQLGRKTRS